MVYSPLSVAGKTKGAALISRRSFAREEFGEGSWSRVLRALSEEDRRRLEGTILDSGWYPFELNAHLDSAIVEVLGDGNTEIFERIGRWSARKNLTGPHRAFVLRRDPQRFLAATDRIYGLYYDTGRRTYESTGPTSGVLTTYDAETFSETDCLTVVGWYKEALAMCGASDVAVTEESCRARGDTACRYRLSWAPSVE